MLEQVVVIGYGTQKKSDLTGSVAVVDTEALKQTSHSNISTMLEGKVSGVQVTSDGQPGADPTVRIRGVGSFGDTSPLYVIDGVPMGTSIRDFSSNDIETIQILKDASAAAIYGSRASNGVIIITTKKGKNGQAPSVSYNGSVSFSKTQKRYDVLSGDEYRAYANQLWGDKLPADLGTANTDWQDQIFRTAVSTDHHVSINGGFKNLPYRVSLGIQTTMVL